MSRVKQAIETALENINSASQNTYGAKVYTFDQVAMILQDIYETATETDEDGMAVLTTDQISGLIEIIEARIDKNISNMSDSDILDEDSLEVSISGTRASIDNIDVDKDNIASEATYGIDDDVYEWFEKHNLTTED